MKDIELAPMFKKHFATFPRDEQTVIERKIDLLRENPEHGSFRRQRLRGTYKGWYEASVSMGIRFVWRYSRNKTLIIVEDIGRHDIMKKYG